MLHGPTGEVGVLQYSNFDEAAFSTKVASKRGVVECWSCLQASETLGSLPDNFYCSKTSRVCMCIYAYIHAIYFLYCWQMNSATLRLIGSFKVRFLAMLLHFTHRSIAGNPGSWQRWCKMNLLQKQKEYTIHLYRNANPRGLKSVNWTGPRSVRFLNLEPNIYFKTWQILCEYNTGKHKLGHVQTCFGTWDCLTQHPGDTLWPFRKLNCQVAGCIPLP